MQVAHPPAQTERPARSQDSERKCLVTGEVLPKADLIRFVVGPEDSVVPDLAQNLPGRGLWVKATRAEIETAVNKNLFSRAAKTAVKVDAGLADQVAQLMRKRCLQFVAIGKRSGIAVLGEAQVKSALRTRKLSLLIIANDAARPVDNRYNVPENKSFNRHELGAVLGYDQIVYAGLEPHTLTEKLSLELARLEKLTAPTHIHTGNGIQ